MKVFISSNNENTNWNESGIMSTISWDNPEVQVAINTLFHVKENEVIEAIIINKQGIKAKFKGQIL